MKNRRKRPDGETTRILWDANLEEYRCEACGSILHWYFGFRDCPYCRREITLVEERRVRTSPTRSAGMIAR